MEKERLEQATFVIAVCSALYYCCGIPLRHKNYIYPTMIWNLFLAVLPLFFALLCYLLSGRGLLPRALKAASVIAWFFFFPNSPYLITDFIHIADNGSGSAFFKTNLSDWVKLVFIGGGVFLGTAAGMLSLYIIHRLLGRKLGALLSALAVGAVSLASGYAIYIGRFLRYNSWDVLKPHYLLSHLKADFRLFSLEFSALFAAYTLLCYIVFYFIYHRRESGSGRGRRY